MKGKKTLALRQLEALALAYAALICAVYFLYFGAGGYVNLSRAKRVMYYCLTGGYLALTAVLAVYALGVKAFTLRDLRERLLPVRWPVWLLLGYLAATALACVLSPYARRTILGCTRDEGLVTIALYVLCTVCLAAFCRPRRWLLWVLGAAALAQSVLVTVQLTGANPLGLYPEGESFFTTGERFAGGVGNIDLLGAWFCAAIPILAVGTLRGKGKFRFLLLIPLAAAVYACLRVGVLASFVGIAGGLALAAPFALRFSGKGVLRYYIVLALLGLAALIACYFLPQTGQMYRMLHGEFDPSFGSGRIYIWREVLARCKGRWLFGWGPDTMALADIPPFTRYDAELGVTVTANIDTAHSEYLNILYHQGIAALACYLAALALTLFRAARAAKTSDGCAVLGAAVLCYAVGALFSISQLCSSPALWLSLGLLLGAVREERRVKSEK